MTYFTYKDTICWEEQHHCYLCLIDALQLWDTYPLVVKKWYWSKLCAFFWLNSILESFFFFQLETNNSEWSMIHFIIAMIFIYCINIALTVRTETILNWSKILSFAGTTRLWKPITSCLLWIGREQEYSSIFYMIASSSGVENMYLGLHLQPYPIKPADYSRT